MRTRAKRDTAEAAIVQALRQVGAMVVHISSQNGPDLLVKFGGRWWPLEVKSGKGRATAGQSAMGYPLVRTVSEALAAIGVCV